MQQYYWNSWYSGWGWFLWFGVWFLILSSFGNWGYTYRAHRKFEDNRGKDALDILNERYARSEITREEYTGMKRDITEEIRGDSKKSA